MNSSIWSNIFVINCMYKNNYHLNNDNTLITPIISFNSGLTRMQNDNNIRWNSITWANDYYYASVNDNSREIACQIRV